MQKYSVALSEDKVFIWKHEPDSKFPPVIPIMTMSTLDAYDLGNELIRVVLLKEDNDSNRD